MRLLGTAPGRVHLEVTEAELHLLNAALNEICNGVDFPFFETRIGATRAEVAALLAEVSVLLTGR